VNDAYLWWVESDAYHYLADLPKRKRRGLERAIDEIASHPFRKALFTDRTPEGSLLELTEVDGHLITYHADHALRRILVMEILPLS
jgi:hypothetical protein